MNVWLDVVGVNSDFFDRMENVPFSIYIGYRNENYDLKYVADKI